MAKKITGMQMYPRILDEDNKFFLFLDDTQLKPHKTEKIPFEKITEIIKQAIEYANKKSSRKSIGLTDNMSPQEIDQVCIKEGKKLFNYFLKYCGDPASTAHACINKSFKNIAKEQFRNRLLQKQRMNSGWRYQHIAKAAAIASDRFSSVSDLNSIEADFNAIIEIQNSKENLNIYVSVKNRTNTMGGQDWPKAIKALEDAAKSDKNKDGAYICVFGIAMEKGLRNIKCSKRTEEPYSINTEVWLSDYFWPFFANYKYDEIVKSVLKVLIEDQDQDDIDVEIPDALINSFGEQCKNHGLLDDSGKFNNAFKLADLFCGIGSGGKKKK